MKKYTVVVEVTVESAGCCGSYPTRKRLGQYVAKNLPLGRQENQLLKVKRLEVVAVGRGRKLGGW